MDETRNEAGGTGAPSQGTANVKAKAKRKSPAKRLASRTGSAPARKKAGAARREPKKKPASLEGLLRDFSKRASKAGASIASISGGGFDSAKKAIGSAGAASRSTIDRLTHEWRRMDARKRAQFAAALLAALAAASAPIVRSSLKKK
ncbi:MAG: hypothetical protein M3167_13625 [Acidobacteriota bacterium]|nr:hypothetical protein [Acidobacteriota bacterium]